MTRLVQSGDGPIFPSNGPEWLESIMLRGRCAARKIGAEDGECIMFADQLRQAALTGRLHATFTHIPHEVGGGGTSTVENGKRVFKGRLQAQIRYSLAKALGLISGSGDYVFVWKGGGCWIEFKRSKLDATAHRERRDAGRLNKHQKAFQQWCGSLDVPYHVVTSAREGLDILAGYGVLDTVG